MSDLNGYPPRQRPAIPTLLLIAAIVVAVGAVSALIWVLFSETEGPAPVLRTFAERVRDDDCPGSHELLDLDVRQATPQEAWCAALPRVRELLDPGFEVEQMLLREGVAELTIRSRLSSEAQVWSLRKVDDTWRVLGPTGGLGALLEPVAA